MIWKAALSGGLFGIGHRLVALAGPEIQDRIGDDVVTAYFHAVGLILAAAKLSLDMDLRALLVYLANADTVIQ